MDTRRSHAAGASIARALRLVAAAAIAAVAGCSAVADEPVTEPAAIERADAYDCGDYGWKQCDPQSVIDYIDAHDEESSDAFYDCGGCSRGLIQAGVLAKGIGPLKLLAAADALWNFVSTSHDCQQCFDFVEDTGVLEVLSCTVELCEYSYDAHLAECQSQCGYIGEHGYIAQGAANCICTPVEQEASCRVECADDLGYHINGECFCEKEAPPPPPPECSGGDDGYFCSSDPETGMDRACCGGECVVWECSACDWENPYCAG